MSHNLNGIYKPYLKSKLKWKLSLFELPPRLSDWPKKCVLQRTCGRGRTDSEVVVDNGKLYGDRKLEANNFGRRGAPHCALPSFPHAPCHATHSLWGLPYVTDTTFFDYLAPPPKSKIFEAKKLSQFELNWALLAAFGHNL